MSDSNKDIFIFGVDPGKTTGLCLVRFGDGGIEILDRRDIEPNDPTEDFSDEEFKMRMRNVYLALGSYMMQVPPWADPVMVVERPFMARGASTIEATAMYGVCALAASQLTTHINQVIEFRGYAVQRIRMHVCGTARAKDRDVQAEVRKAFGISANPGKGKGLGKHQPHALACALAYLREEYWSELPVEAQA